MRLIGGALGTRGRVSGHDQRIAEAAGTSPAPSKAMMAPRLRLSLNSMALSAVLESKFT